MIKYLIPFLISFLITVASTAFLMIVAKKIKWHSRKEKRHIHKNGVHRIGGIAMVLAFNIAVILDRNLVISSELYGLMIGTVVLMLVGFWDDIREMYWKFQLFSQIAVAMLIFVAGVRIYYITNPLTGGILKMDMGFWVVLATILVIFWITLVINAVNWLDGVDGLSGGITLISSATIFILSLRPEVNQPPVAIICAIFLGTALGFLIYNFNPARVLAGTSGAMYMGLVLAVLAIFSGTKIATAFLVLAIPITDLMWVIMERIRNGKSIFRPDKSHLHYRLLELGWSQKKIALHYYVLTVFIAVIALNTKFIGKSIALALVVVTMLIIFLVIEKKIAHKHKKINLAQ
jgi:UDP-GlcNAc:undecaprenyl-phosphate GlcNAc-1-phosphate transferase